MYKSVPEWRDELKQGVSEDMVAWWLHKGEEAGYFKSVLIPVSKGSEQFRRVYKPRFGKKKIALNYLKLMVESREN